MTISLHSRIINQRGFYSGGKKTLANRDFWNGTADFETIASADRDTLRARARWLHENNPIMANIDRAIVNNVIGSGISLRYTSTAKRRNKVITEAFLKWATNRKLCDITKRFTFYDMQRLCLQNRMMDGEIFIRKVKTPTGLQLQLLEADNLDKSQGTGGITLDTYGAPSVYHFAVRAVDGSETKFTVPADDLINYYRAERPSQYRGVTEYKQAMVDVKNFSAFQTATVEGARARANIAYGIERGSPGAGYTGKDPVTGADITEINGVSVVYTRPGEKLIKLDPANAGNDYAIFSSSTIRLLATARGVSYELAFKDYSQVNYASSRASLLQDYKRFDYEQSHLSEYFLNEVFEAWLELEISLGKVPVPLQKYFKDPSAFHTYRWVYPKRDWVDPLKDVTALEKELLLGLTNATDEAESRGENYEKNMAAKQKEIELQNQYGVYDEMHATSAGSVNMGGNNDATTTLA